LTLVFLKQKAALSNIHKVLKKYNASVRAGTTSVNIIVVLHAYAIANKHYWNDIAYKYSWHLIVSTDGKAIWLKSVIQERVFYIFFLRIDLKRQWQDWQVMVRFFITLHNIYASHLHAVLCAESVNTAIKSEKSCKILW